MPLSLGDRGQHHAKRVRIPGANPSPYSEAPPIRGIYAIEGVHVCSNVPIFCLESALALRAASASSAMRLAPSSAACLYTFLNGRAGYRTIGTENAAACWKRPKCRAAAFAVVDGHAGIGRHGFNRLMPAMRTGQS